MKALLRALKFRTDLEPKMVFVSGIVLNLLHLWTYGTMSEEF